MQDDEALINYNSSKKQSMTAEQVDYTLDVISIAIKTLNAEVLELRKRVEALENKPTDYDNDTGFDFRNLKKIQF